MKLLAALAWEKLRVLIVKWLLFKIIISTYLSIRLTTCWSKTINGRNTISSVCFCPSSDAIHRYSIVGTNKLPPFGADTDTSWGITQKQKFHRLGSSTLPERYRKTSQILGAGLSGAVFLGEDESGRKAGSRAGAVGAELGWPWKWIAINRP